MLNFLNVRNFAIVESLEVDWSAGMTTITGETGAGKSIAIDALALCLGDRAEASMVRQGADKAEVCAIFDITQLTVAKTWLKEHELCAEPDSNSSAESNTTHECIIRRVISKEGRSKGYINGSPVPVSQLKQLGQLLVSIHGQHAHQLLLKSDHQRNLLDEYAAHTPLLNSTAHAYSHWQQLKKERSQLLEAKLQDDAKRQLLEYQVSELNEFDLQPNEYEEIEQQHKKLSGGQEILDECLLSLNTIYDNDQQSAHNLIDTAAQQLAKLSDLDNDLKPIADLLFEASVQVEEAARELRHFSDNIELDPSLLQDVEERMAAAVSLARKHNIPPQQLPEYHAQLAEQLASINGNADRLNELDEQIESAHQAYLVQCQQLSESRQHYAQKLNKLISKSMQQLSMPNGKFEMVITQLDQEKGQRAGLDVVDFNVTTNPGQPLQPLGKVASGGELSRISLAIQVIIAAKVTTPTLIFDEVDVGVSGPTAASVGKLLRLLGESTQVVCITHLPQVASQGHQQLFVRKDVKNNHTHTAMTPLSQTERITEIARLLGGETISETSLANAEELLAVG
ncbi:DNA repair protein RecN [Flocculibacter collagenilyticus]|uniref:DNA repair protein RecN n=1 Tax=Flocculibacter collagenilyticus TaxID=2744479 RepID=UPI0018F5F124|nr:DNA repair protein RecN [Flocculibacter collagenilyticus]